MLVKILAGRNAGEIRDISNDVALDMIRAGRFGAANAPEAPAPRIVAAEPPRATHGPKKKEKASR